MAEAVRVFEMTLGRAEFLRLLPAAVGGEPFSGEAVLEHRGPGRHWRIRLEPLPPLRLGPIPMERLRVEVVMEGFAEDAAEAFISRFLRHYQRGGG